MMHGCGLKKELRSYQHALFLRASLLLSSLGGHEQPSAAGRFQAQKTTTKVTTSILHGPCLDSPGVIIYTLRHLRHVRLFVQGLYVATCMGETG